MSQNGWALQGGLSTTEVVGGLCGLIRVLEVARGGGAGVLLSVVVVLLVVVVVVVVVVTGTIVSIFFSSCWNWRLY